MRGSWKSAAPSLLDNWKWTRKAGRSLAINIYVFRLRNPRRFVINHYTTALPLHLFDVIVIWQIQELTTRAQEATNVVSTEWEGVSQVSSTYVIDCVRPEDQGLKYCVSVSKNIVAQSAATVLLVNSE